MRILDHIGYGGYGRVDKVLVDGEVYANKIFTSRYPQQKMADFQEEKDAFLHLRKIGLEGKGFPIAVEFDEKEASILMKYCPGKTLYQIAKSKIFQKEQLTEFRLKRFLKIFTELFKILTRLAEHGLVHRDVKPQNIIVNKNGGITLIDIGIIRKEGDEDGRRYTHWFRSLSAMCLPAIHQDDVFAGLVTMIHLLVPYCIKYAGQSTKDQRNIWIEMMSMEKRKSFLENIAERGLSPYLLPTIEHLLRKIMFFSSIEQDLFEVRKRIDQNVSIKTKIKFLRALDILENFLDPITAKEICNWTSRSRINNSPINSLN